MPAKVLIVDDDASFCAMLATQVQHMGYAVATAATLREGLEKAHARSFDVLLLDVNLPDGSGLDRMEEFRKGAETPEIIIVTGFGDPDGARLAMERGVWDYISKGASLDSAKMSISRALQYRQSRQAARTPVSLRIDGLLGQCPAFRSCLDAVARAAGSMVNVLITGETGTGKELFAKAIHANSCRGAMPFVVVDCAALPDTLVEGTLFDTSKAPSPEPTGTKTDSFGKPTKNPLP